MVSRQDLVSALDSGSFDKNEKNVILDMIDKHHDMVKILSEAKDKDEKPLFDALEIDHILFNCKDTIENHPDRITTILNNPKEIDIISSFKDKGYGLWRVVGEPLDSTIEKNPEAFGYTIEAIAAGQKRLEELEKDLNLSDRDLIDSLRKKLEKYAGKIDKKLETNIPDIKQPKKINGIEAEILRRSGKPGR